MKVILSRKGFDSKFGGSPSLIMKDNTIISLPIPSEFDNVKYSDLSYKDKTYPELFSEQLGKSKVFYNKTEMQISNARCHLDPDIYRSVISRDKNWKGAFGQTGIAQKHLEKENVSVGDLFLFFGWFKKPETKKDIHVMWGYLKVGKIIKSADEVDKNHTWLKKHPHYHYFKDLNKHAGNTIYIAADTLDDGMPGYGTFKYNDDLVLTADGRSRSKWKNKYNDLFEEISYHNVHSKQDEFFQSATIGQEFVVRTGNGVENWALNLIKNHGIL